MPNPRTLTGLAIGDALGMPYEQREYKDPFLTSWDGSYQPCPDSHPFCKGLKPGQWTDDTKMARALAYSLLGAKTYSPVHAATHYLAWYTSKDWRGIGTATKEALVRLADGKMWMESGTKDAEGNGTAMRVAPLGLFLRNKSPEVIAECARLDATITHDSNEAREGSVIIALSVAFLANGCPKEDLVDSVAATGCVRGSRVLGRLKDAVYFAWQSRPESAVEILATVMGTEGHVTKTVPAAIFCLLATSSFRGAVELAVRAGGDADTTAAVTGALAGTLYGSEQVLPMTTGLEGAQDMFTMDADLFAAGGR